MRLTNISILVLFIIIFSCTSNKTIYYPNEKIFNESNCKEIKLDTYENVVKQIIKLYDESNKAFVVLKNQNTIKKINLRIAGNGLLRLRNTITISKDSIFTLAASHSINKLPILIEKHYLNYGKTHYLSDSPEKAFVTVSLKKNQSKEDLEYLLEKITNDFDNLKKKSKKELKLYIIVEDLFLFPKPPPLKE